MNYRIAKFEKISKGQLVNDGLVELSGVWNTIQLPRRATTGSCGYDFKSPIDIYLKPGGSTKIPSLMRCKILPGWFLMIVPRSSLGFKYRCQLDNTVGIIDSDYYNALNEGHIWIKITNDGHQDLHIKYGDAFCQGIFLQYGITEDDDADGIRYGGIGSTNE